MNMKINRIKQLKPLAAVLALSLPLLACKSAEVRYQEAGHQPLNAEQIRQLLAGNTLLPAPSENASWIVFYAADGSAKGASDASDDTGQWRIKDHQFCSKWKQWRTSERCFNVYRNKQGEVLWFHDGQKSWTTVLESGNSRKL